MFKGLRKFNLTNCKFEFQDKYLFIDDGPYLESLEHIVDYYSFIADGLPTTLECPVPPSPKPPVPEFSTIPRHKKKIPSQPPLQSKRPDEFGSQDIHTLSDSIPSQFQNIKFNSVIRKVPVPSVNNNYMTDNSDTNSGYIPFENLELGAIIGKGEFGSVHKGNYKKENGETMLVAIKTLLNEHVEANRGAFLNEAQLMMKLNHHCIVKFVGLSEGPQLLMVQELIPLGSMLTYIIIHKGSVNPNYEFKIWAAQIACGKLNLTFTISWQQFN